MNSTEVSSLAAPNALQLTRGTISKRLHTDNAKEYIGAAIRTYLHAQGTSTTTTFPHSSAQNGAAECAIRTVITHVRCNILAAGLPETFWPYAALDAVNKLNATPRRAPNDPNLRPISPHELFYGIQPPTKHFPPIWPTRAPDPKHILNHVLRSLVSCTHPMSTSTSSYS
jgi:hypothetical protein